MHIISILHITQLKEFRKNFYEEVGHPITRYVCLSGAWSALKRQEED